MGMEPRTREGGTMALVVTRKSLHDDNDLDDVDYWLSRPILERLAAIDHIRREHEGWHDAPEPELCRVARVSRSA